MLDYMSVKKLVTYGIRTGMLAPSDEVWAVNQLLEVLQMDSMRNPRKKSVTSTYQRYWIDYVTVRWKPVR